MSDVTLDVLYDAWCLASFCPVLQQILCDRLLDQGQEATADHLRFWGPHNAALDAITGGTVGAGDVVTGTEVVADVDVVTGVDVAGGTRGYYLYVLVGWLRHLEGLEWEVVNARLITTIGGDGSLDDLAAKGPQLGTRLRADSGDPEPVWRPNVIRVRRCNLNKWLKYCPKPKDFA